MLGNTHHVALKFQILSRRIRGFLHPSQAVCVCRCRSVSVRVHLSPFLSLSEKNDASSTHRWKTQQCETRTNHNKSKHNWTFGSPDVDTRAVHEHLRDIKILEGESSTLTIVSCTFRARTRFFHPFPERPGLEIGGAFLRAEPEVVKRVVM